MSSQNDLGFVSLLATVGISAWVAVDINSDGSISPVNSATAYKGIGVTQEAAIAGRYINVKLWSAPGTFNIIVSPGQIIVPGVQYGISQGYISATVTASLEALQAGVSASGIVLEFTKL